MENFPLPEISSVFTVIIHGTVLALFFFLIGRLIAGLKESLRLFSFLDRVRPVIYTAGWFMFLFWAIFNFFPSQHGLGYAVSGIVLLFIGLSSWFVIKEAIAGIIFRMEKHVQVDDQIRTPAVQGIIQRVGYRYLEVQTDGRQTAILPYSELIGKAFLKNRDTSSVNMQTITLDIPRQEDLQTSLKKIKSIIYHSTWVSLNPEPKISITSEKETVYTVTITIAILSADYLTEIEQAIKKEMSGE